MSHELELHGVRAGYGSVEVLHGVDMAAPAGCIVAMVGSNAAGKTTLLRCIAGLVAVRSGTISWAGRDITHTSAYERAARGMVLVPDRRNVFASLTVRENLELFARGADVDPAIETFPALADLLPRRTGTLSGGERKMVALSHAVVRPSRVVLLDEPSGGLSPLATSSFYDSLTRDRTTERTYIIVEQYLEDVVRVADIVYRLQRGRVEFAGEPGELDHLRSGAMQR